MTDLRVGGDRDEHGSAERQAYDDHGAGVRDPWGNSWFIATHLKDVAF